MLTFVFLLFTSMVSIWRDLGNSQLSLATAWNVTNTFILGAFMIVAMQGELADQAPAEEPVPDPVEHLAGEEPAAPLTTVIVPPELAEALGVPELATAKSNALHSGHDGTPTTTDHETDHQTEPAAKRALQDEKEVAAK